MAFECNDDRTGIARGLHGRQRDRSVGAKYLRLAIVLGVTVAFAAFGRLSVQAQSLGSTPITIGSVAGEDARVLRDGFGREITLRGFNVSGSTKLTESGFLPFRSTTDAQRGCGT
jgi:hypothetical protein